MCTDQEQGPVAPLAPSATPSSLLAPARRGGELQSTSLQPLIENSATSSFPIPPADWDSFRDGMRHCAWYLSAEHGASFLYGSTVGELYANASNGTLTSQMPPAPLSTCQWTSDEDELWVARRIGPFTSTGGYPWYDLQVTDEWPELSAVLRERSETWLTGISTLTTDAKAEVLGFPPMHMHHSHVRKRDSQMPLILNHQDRVCGEPELRSRCFLTLFPEPYGLLLDQNLVMDSVFNDVRTAGCSPISWYVEYAVKIAPPQHQQRRVSRTSLLMWFTSHLAVAEQARMRFATFPVPAGTPAVSWVHTVPTVSGIMTTLWMHTHEGLGFEQTWFFDAPPKALGLDLAPFVQRLCSPFVPRAHNLTISDVKRHVRTCSREANAPLRCVAKMRADFDPRLGDMQPTWSCRDGVVGKLVAGQSFTSVTFFNTIEDAHGMPYLGQHIHYQAYLASPEQPNQPFQQVVDYPESDGSTPLVSQRPSWRPNMSENDRMQREGPLFASSAECPHDLPPAPNGRPTPCPVHMGHGLWEYSK